MVGRSCIKERKTTYMYENCFVYNNDNIVYNLEINVKAKGQSAKGKGQKRIIKIFLVVKL